MNVTDWRDAAASAVESSVRRAEHCPACGMLKGSGLGAHYVGCPRDPATVVPLFVDPDEVRP